MEANLRSMTETGKVLRSIGKSEGAPRAGRKAVETVWKLVEQDRPQADIKQVMVTAAKMAATSNRRTITPDLIQSADEIVRNIRKR